MDYDNRAVMIRWAHVFAIERWIRMMIVHRLILHILHLEDLADILLRLPLYLLVVVGDGGFVGTFVIVVIVCADNFP